MHLNILHLKLTELYQSCYLLSSKLTDINKYTVWHCVVSIGRRNILPECILKGVKSSVFQQLLCSCVDTSSAAHHRNVPKVVNNNSNVAVTHPEFMLHPVPTFTLYVQTGNPLPVKNWRTEDGVNIAKCKQLKEREKPKEK